MWTLVAFTAVASALLGAMFVHTKLPESPAAPSRIDRYALALAVVLALLWLNQVAFNAYVYGAQGGSTAFIGRDLGSVLFSHMAPHHPAVRLLQRLIPDPRWLAPSALRVQAVLELPFAALAYLSVARLVDRSIARQIAAGPIGVLLCVSYTIVLCGIEVLLQNRYTSDDLALRFVAVLLTIPLLRALAGPPVAPDTPSFWRLLWFGLGLGGMGVVVMGTNLMALLYNLGWLDTLGWPMAAAAIVVVAATWASGAAVPASQSWLILLLFAFGRRFTLLFAAPALAIRYAWGHGHGTTAAAVAMGFVTLLSLVLGVRDAVAQLPTIHRVRWGARFGAGLIAATGAAFFDPSTFPGFHALGLPDVWFLVKAGLVFGGFVVGWGLVSLASRR